MWSDIDYAAAVAAVDDATAVSAADSTAVDDDATDAADAVAAANVYTG